MEGYLSLQLTYQSLTSSAWSQLTIEFVLAVFQSAPAPICHIKKTSLFSSTYMHDHVCVMHWLVCGGPLAAAAAAEKGILKQKNIQQDCMATQLDRANGPISSCTSRQHWTAHNYHNSFTPSQGSHMMCMSTCVKVYFYFQYVTTISLTQYSTVWLTYHSHTFLLMPFVFRLNKCFSLQVL